MIDLINIIVQYECIEDKTLFLEEQDDWIKMKEFIIH